jgi:hypothetical protein
VCTPSVAPALQSLEQTQNPEPRHQVIASKRLTQRGSCVATRVPTNGSAAAHVPLSCAGLAVRSASAVQDHSRSTAVKSAAAPASEVAARLLAEFWAVRRRRAGCSPPAKPARPDREGRSPGVAPGAAPAGAALPSSPAAGVPVPAWAGAGASAAGAASAAAARAPAAGAPAALGAVGAAAEGAPDAEAMAGVAGTRVLVVMGQSAKREHEGCQRSTGVETGLLVRANPHSVHCWRCGHRRA